MRTMTGNSMGEQGTINVVEHIVTKNWWEFYIIDDPENVRPEGYATCVSVTTPFPFGRIRDVYLPEIEPFIASRTTRLDEVFPAPGWSWVESN